MRGVVRTRYPIFAASSFNRLDDREPAAYLGIIPIIFIGETSTISPLGMLQSHQRAKGCILGGQIGRLETNRYSPSKTR